MRLHLHGVRHRTAAEDLRRRTGFPGGFVHAQCLRTEAPGHRHRHPLEIRILRPVSQTGPDDGRAFWREKLWIPGRHGHTVQDKSVSAGRAGRGMVSPAGCIWHGTGVFPVDRPARKRPPRKDHLAQTLRFESRDLHRRIHPARAGQRIAHGGDGLATGSLAYERIPRTAAGIPAVRKIPGCG